MERLKDLIELYYTDKEYTRENVEENRILVERDGCNLIKDKNNKEEHGYYIVESIQGHDCYSYNSISTHIYHIIDGEGEFIIDNQIYKTKTGDTITIKPNQIFYYKGKMLLLLEMIPDFKDEYNHIVRKISYKKRPIYKKEGINNG